MPYHKSPYKFGNLFVVFKVIFPDSLKDPQMAKLTEAIGSMKKKSADVDMDIAETCDLKEYKEHHRNKHHEGGEGGNGSDEEEGDEQGHGGQKVRCAQQ